MANTIDSSVIVSTHIRYHRWATVKMFELVSLLTPEQLHQDLNTSYKSICGTLGHMYQADATWWARLVGDMEHAQPSLNTVPETFSALELAWRPVLGQFVDWALSEPDWAMDLCYSNSAGKEFRTPFWQVILHLVNHGTHHRGQVVGMIRQLGGTPQNTDSIIYYRLGCPD